MMIHYPHNLRAIIVIAIVLVVATISFMRLNSKPKKDYQSVTGKIIYLENTYKNFPIRGRNKYRYIIVDGYNYPFEIYVGKSFGDFKPKIDRIDELKTGDRISVFFYETDNTHAESINRFTQFIDKGKISFYERGEASHLLGITMIALCGLLILLGLRLYKRKKIPY